MRLYPPRSLAAQQSKRECAKDCSCLFAFSVFLPESITSTVPRRYAGCCPGPPAISPETRRHKVLFPERFSRHRLCRDCFVGSPQPPYMRCEVFPSCVIRTIYYFRCDDYTPLKSRLSTGFSDFSPATGISISCPSSLRARPAWIRAHPFLHR